MINLTKLQEEIFAWKNHNFPLSGEEEQFIGVVEELGELAHTRLKIRQGIRNIDIASERDAIGDLLIYLMNYASERGYTIEGILEETWKEVGARDWIKHPINGVTL